MKNGTTAKDLLARAALFQTLARGFHYPTAGQSAEIADALSQHIRARDGSRPMALLRTLTAARTAWRSASLPHLQAEYARLFLTGIGSPLHETAYGDGRRMAGRTTEIADISGFYLAFGMRLSEREADLPDHICAELEFYSVLMVKHAYALSRHWVERRRITECTTRTFMDYHLGRWVKAFADSLSEQAPPAPYRAMAKLLVAVVAEECRRLRIHPQLLTGRINRDEMQAENFICPHDTGKSRVTAHASAV